MNSLEYDSTLVYTKDKKEKWKPQKPERILDYGGFSLDIDKFDYEDYEKLKENMDELKDMFTAVKLRDLAPFPTIGSICMVFGWHKETVDTELDWVSKDTATFGVITSIEMPLQDEVKSLDVEIDLLYLDSGGNPQWHTTEVSIKKLESTNIFGEDVIVNPPEEVDIDDLSIFIPSDVYIAHLFDLDEQLVSLTI